MGRVEAAEAVSDRTGAVVLLKGADTVVTSGSGSTYINTTGNPGMATGGSGDVLTGVITAFAASGIAPLDAARAGAFVHGMAGDLAAGIMGQWGMTATDIRDQLPADASRNRREIEIAQSDCTAAKAAQFQCAGHKRSEDFEHQEGRPLFCRS